MLVARKPQRTARAATMAFLWFGPVFASHKTAKRCAAGNTSVINCSHLPAMSA
jgi:hypothetical protein